MEKTLHKSNDRSKKRNELHGSTNFAVLLTPNVAFLWNRDENLQHWTVTLHDAEASAKRAAALFGLQQQFHVNIRQFKMRPVTSGVGKSHTFVKPQRRS